MVGIGARLKAGWSDGNPARVTRRTEFPTFRLNNAIILCLTTRPKAWRSKLDLVLATVILAGLANMATASSIKNSACGTYSVEIVDETRSISLHPVTVDLADVTDMNFKAFVGAVSNHVLATVCAEANDKDVQLLFIKRPLVKQAGGTADNLPAANRPSGPDLRHLDSPWARLEMSGQPVRRISAVFVWNERQFLRDQTVLAGGSPASKGPPVSIEAAALARYSQDYANLIVLAPPETSKAVLSGLATRLPPEILWLYRHAVQSTRASFSVFAMAALDATLSKAGRSYADIATSLFDRCFGSVAGTNEHYNNVLELKGITNLEAYRIETLI